MSGGRTEITSVAVEAELRASIVTAQLAHCQISGPADTILRGDDAYRLNMCFMPRGQNARACYSERWEPKRFEPLGKIFLLPPGETLQARNDSDSRRQTSITCRLLEEPMRAWFEGDLEWTDHRLKASLDISSANIRNLLLRLCEEMRHPGFASYVLAELIAAQMAIELSRYFTAVSESPTSGGLAPWRLRLIEERLREVSEAPTLAELAELCNISVRQLARGFRTSRGCSIGDYVVECRIENAKKLLASDESIKAIAYTLGFASPSNFSDAFRRVTGETPSEFRQRTFRFAH